MTTIPGGHLAILPPGIAAGSIRVHLLRGQILLLYNKAMQNIELLRQLQLPSVSQLGFVVRDLAAALPAYSALYGIRTWYETDLSGTRFAYKGQEIQQNLRVVLGFWGKMQIELICSYDSTSNLYTDFLAAHEEGLQHVACDVSNLENILAAARRLGVDPIYRSWFTSPGGVTAQCAYLDLRPYGGAMVELVEGRWNGWPVRNTPFSLQLGAWLGQVKTISL